jgi:NAD(P)-dependent dehydrogenase (short-subunit alcohol dehydrogenase family)
VATIEALGGTAIALRADLANEQDIEDLVDQAHTRLGRISVLVNNAALTVGGRPRSPDTRGETTPEIRLSGAPSVLDVPLKAYRRHFAINVFAPYRLMQLVLPDMIEAERGAIVNVSSRSAFNPGEGPYLHPGQPALFAYGSSKAALHNLTQAVAVETANRGVAVNALIPSRPILTPGTAKLMKGQPTDDWSNADDFAAAALRLCLVSPAQATGRVLFHQDVLDNAEPSEWPSAANSAYRFS